MLTIQISTMMMVNMWIVVVAIVTPPARDRQHRHLDEVEGSNPVLNHDHCCISYGCRSLGLHGEDEVATRGEAEGGGAVGGNQAIEVRRDKFR